MCYCCTHREDDINELVKEDELDDEKLVEKTKRKRIQAQRISDWKIRQSGLFQIRKGRMVRKNLELVAVKIRKKKGAQAKECKAKERREITVKFPYCRGTKKKIRFQFTNDGIRGNQRQIRENWWSKQIIQGNRKGEKSSKCFNLLGKQ